MVDVSDPTAPAPVGRVGLGRGDAGFSLASRGDRVFTDAGDTHAIDLSDPTDPVASTFERGPFGSPLVVGGELLSSEGDLASGCVVTVSDPATDPPTEPQRVEVRACQQRWWPSLAPTEAGVVALGVSDEVSVAEALIGGPDGWAAADLLPLPFEPDGAVPTGVGAFVVGDGAGVLLEQSGGSLAPAASWDPRTAFVRSATVAAGLVWVVFSRESGDFEGIVGLRAEPCR